MREMKRKKKEHWEITESQLQKQPAAQGWDMEGESGVTNASKLQGGALRSWNTDV